jgi:hypothetical protein
MVSIHKIPNREGTLYVRMYEGWRENGKRKTAVVKNFGRLDKLQENGWGSFEELQQKVRNGEIEYASRKNQVTKTVFFDENINNSKVLYYGHKLLLGFHSMLEINKVIDDYQKGTKVKYNLSKILELLVILRIISPASKLRNSEDQVSLLLDEKWTYNQIDRSLDHFTNLKDKIQEAMHRNITKLTNRTASLVFRRN